MQEMNEPKSEIEQLSSNFPNEHNYQPSDVSTVEGLTQSPESPKEFHSMNGYYPPPFLYPVDGQILFDEFGQRILDPRMRSYPRKMVNKTSPLWKKTKKKKKPEEPNLGDLAAWPTLDEAVKAPEPLNEKPEKQVLSKHPEAEDNQEEVNKEGQSKENQEVKDDGKGKKKAINWVPLKDAGPTLPPHKQFSSSRGRGGRRRDQGRWSSRSYNNYRGPRRGGRVYANNPYYYSSPAGTYPDFDYAAVYPIPLEGESLQEALLKQMEYYFSVENLCKDIYLRQQMDSEGWLPLSLISNFNRVRMLTTDKETICMVLELSQIIEYDPEQDRIRKKDDWKLWTLPKPEPTSDKQDKEDDPTTSPGESDSTTSLVKEESKESEKPKEVKLSYADKLSTSLKTKPPEKKVAPSSPNLESPRKENQKSNQLQSHSPAKLPEKQQAVPPTTVPNGHQESDGEWITATRRKKSAKNGKLTEEKKSGHLEHQNSSEYEKGDLSSSVHSPQTKNHIRIDHSTIFEEVDPDFLSHLLIFTEQKETRNGKNNQETSKAFSPQHFSLINDELYLFEKKSLASPKKEITHAKNGQVNGSMTTIVFHSPQRLYPAWNKHGMSIGWAFGEESSSEHSQEPPQDSILQSKFSQISYPSFHDLALDERKKLGSGKSGEMNLLFRFWSHFLSNHFEPNTYQEFKSLALEDAKDNQRYGLQCLLRFYSRVLQHKFQETIFREFEEVVLQEHKEGHSYGLQKFSSFLNCSQKTISTQPAPELHQLLQNSSSANSKTKELQEQMVQNPLNGNDQATKSNNPWFQKRAF